MSANGNPGINKLGRVLQERIAACGESPLILDFGTIQENYSLLTNTYPIPIPKTDYTVSRQLTLGVTDGHLTTTETTDSHKHDVLIPDKMRKLKPKDRVLVAWVQNEAVVIDIILPASTL